MTDGAPIDLARFPIHLGLGATAVVCEEFDGTMEWYGRYGATHGADGVEGRLVSTHTFREPWDSWEMHPHGSEIVLCVSGSMVLHQEIDGSVVTTRLGAGQAAVNEPGVWHTADVDDHAVGVFVTAGHGTEHRPR